ncbi:hypothetical protein Dxin01_01095 [Deinococcus xinjiangensis]|uniref:Uncharacterized protein n=1 Tax=Deinococcus xinjiangensis TaxID=457454 RepID=A0ABP9VBG4_9DEIO
MTFNTGLNRVTIGNFEGLPAGMAGSLAHEWLATWSIAPRMRSALDCPDLPAIPSAGKKDILLGAVRDLPKGLLRGPLVVLRQSAQNLQAAKMQACSAYPPALNARLEAGDPQAKALAEQLGVTLAATAATLKLAPAESRAARSEWPAAHWERWQQVQNIVLGGGVLSGTLGRQLHATASQWLPKLGAGELRLHLFPEPRELMLHGLARQFASGPAVVLDAGHTAIKHAFVQLASGEVVQFASAPPLPVPYQISDGRELLAYLVQTFVNTIPTGQTATQFGLSLSAHLDAAGNILPSAASGSFYGSLVGLKLQDRLQEALAQALGQPCTVRVLHEGQAAVRGLAGVDAAILLGTSVGGGFKADGQGTALSAWE